MPAWTVTGSVNRCTLEVTHACGHFASYTYGAPATAEREGPARAAEPCRNCRSQRSAKPAVPQVAPGFEAFLEDEDEPPPF